MALMKRRPRAARIWEEVGCVGERDVGLRSVVWMDGRERFIYTDYDG